MKQECPLAFLYLFWLLLFGGFVYWLVRGEYGVAAVWIVAVPLVQWAYIRSFPSISRFLGYGRVEDRPASEAAPRQVTVTFYTALACPFCPLVKRRLEALRDRMGFELVEVDVTLRPDLLRSKGIRAVPVVEVAGRLRTGNATSDELARFISGEGSD